MKELLQLLCQYPFDESQREHLSELMSKVADWQKLVHLINDHGIIALSAYNIKAAGVEKQVPGEAMSFLENGYLKSLARNTWLTEHWKEVNTILSNEGIKHILLKGMALEHTIYDARGLRQMNDNDILIHPDEALRAWHLLQNAGFSPEMIKSPLHKKIMMDIGKHLPCLYKEGYALEIHERVCGAGCAVRGVGQPAEMGTGHGARGMGQPEVEERLMAGNSARRTPHTAYHIPGLPDPFKDAVEIQIGGTKAFILNKEEHIRYLIDHFETHKAGGNCQFRLYTDIMLLNKNSKIEIPDNFILNPIQENELHFRKAAYRDTFYSIAPKHRLRFITGDIFPSVKWMRKRYKCSTVRGFLYYPFRLAKLIWLI